MAKKRILKDRPKQGVLFVGIEQQEEDLSGPLMIPLDFMSHAVRIVMISGDPWWVLIDACRVLEIVNTTQAASRLDDDEKDEVCLTDPIGRSQKTTVISLSGLLELIMRSDKPQAIPFRKWVTKEVLPSIMKTGGYRLPVHKRVAKEQRRLKCDTDTAVLRVEQFKLNREENERLCSEGVSHSAWYNARYLGAYGKTAQELRELLGLPKKQTPLDRHSRELLAQDLHSKAVACRVIRERSVDPDKQPLVLRTISSQQMKADLARLPGATVGVVDGGKRGLILDFICPVKELDQAVGS